MHSQRVVEVEQQSRVTPQVPFLIGYYTNWGQYRPGSCSFKPPAIEPIANSLTHLHYAFAKIDTSGNVIPIGACRGAPNLRSHSHSCCICSSVSTTSASHDLLLLCTLVFVMYAHAQSGTTAHLVHGRVAKAPRVRQCTKGSWTWLPSILTSSLSSPLVAGRGAAPTHVQRSPRYCCSAIVCMPCLVLTRVLCVSRLQMAASAAARATFVKQTVEFCHTFDWAGVSIDWYSTATHHHIHTHKNWL